MGSVSVLREGRHDGEGESPPTRKEVALCSSPTPNAAEASGRRPGSLELLVEVVPPAVHEDEGKEVNDVDRLDRFHPQLRILEDVHVLDVLPRED